MSILNPNEYLLVLDRHGLTIPEWSILLNIGRSPKPLSAAARRHVDLFNGDPRGLSNKSSLDAALSSCLAKGWVRVIDESALDEIRSFLKSKAMDDPVYGLPYIGYVDFTPDGAELYMKVHDEIFGIDWDLNEGYERDQEANKIERFYQTKKAALEFTEDYRRQPDCVSVSDPVEVGPWCVHWWLRHERGYRIDIEMQKEPKKA